MSTSENLFATHQVIFRAHGENASTPRSPMGVYVEGEVNLDETVTIPCADRLVEKKVYEVLPVTLPAWLSVEEWVENASSWHFAWSAGVMPSWSEHWQRSLFTLPFEELYALCWGCMRTNPRGDFKKSIKAQIEEWLNQKDEERRYPNHLSVRQMDALYDYGKGSEAEQAGERVYQDLQQRSPLGCAAWVVTEKPARRSKKNQEPQEPPWLQVTGRGIL